MSMGEVMDVRFTATNPSGNLNVTSTWQPSFIIGENYGITPLLISANKGNIKELSSQGKV